MSQSILLERDQLLARVADLEAALAHHQRETAALAWKHHSLFEGTTDAIFVIDLATLLIVDANANAAKRLGYSQAVLSQLKLTDIDASEADYAAHYTPPASIAAIAERLYRRKDGSLLPVEVRGFMTEFDGKDYLVNFVRDVNTLKQTQEALRVSEDANQQFKEKLKILNEISFELDQADSFDILCRLAIELGCQRLGFDRLGLWFLDDNKEFMVGSFGVDEHGQIRDERNQRFRADASAMLVGITGRKIEVAVQDNVDLLNDRSESIGKGWSAAATLWDGDAVIGYINTDNLLSGEPPEEYFVELLQIYAATVAYLAKSKRAEQQVRQLSRAIDQSSSMVMITDPAGDIEYVNPRFTIVTGYTAEEVIGTNPRFLKSGHTSLDEYETMWQTIISGNEWCGEFRNRRKNGDYYWALSSISPVKSPEGVITNFVSVQEDITALKEAQQQRLELAIEREKVQILANFIADVAHEFKTPLAVINTTLYLLEHTATTQDDLSRLLVIKEQSSDINLLLDAMLTMARLDKSDAEQLVSLNVNDLVREAAANVATLTSDKNLCLSLSLADLPKIRGNDENLLRAITEILHNAIQASCESGDIMVRTFTEQSAITIEVADHGVGISEENLPHIFDRFYRVDKARSTRGSGLGLSIAKKVVESHQGHIKVESLPGTGSTFRIVLPLATA